MVISPDLVKPLVSIAVPLPSIAVAEAARAVGMTAAPSPLVPLSSILPGLSTRP